MPKLFYILVYSFAFSSALIAQEKGDFHFEFGVNAIKYNMSEPQNYDDLDTLYDYYDDVNKVNKKFNNMNQGISYDVGIFYQPLRWMDFGLTTSYQSSKLLRNILALNYANPSPDGTYPEINGSIENKITAYSAGVGLQLYVNKLFYFEKKNSPLLRKIAVSIGFKAMYGLSEFTEKSGLHNSTNPNWEIQNIRYSGTNFLYRTELKLGYHLFHKSLFSDVGLKIGYQYGKTKPLKNFAGYKLSINNNTTSNVTLNFSSIYYGIYFIIGR
jgi:hypothetical protein